MSDIRNLLDEERRKRNSHRTIYQDGLRDGAKAEREACIKAVEALSDKYGGTLSDDHEEAIQAIKDRGV